MPRRYCKSLGLEQALEATGLHVSWEEAYLSPLYTENAGEMEISNAEALPLVADYCQALYGQVEAAIAQNVFPIAIGGDHSMAIGTWSAVVNALDMRQKFGLIWIDAHLDAHTPHTSPSQAYHGMPVASLLGEGPSELASIGGRGQKIAPEHICFVGARSYEEGEHLFLQQRDVKIFYMEELRERGMGAVMNDARSLCNARNRGFWHFH